MWSPPRRLRRGEERRSRRDVPEGLAARVQVKRWLCVGAIHVVQTRYAWIDPTAILRPRGKIVGLPRAPQTRLIREKVGRVGAGVRPRPERVGVVGDA